MKKNTNKRKNKKKNSKSPLIYLAVFALVVILAAVFFAAIGYSGNHMSEIEEYWGKFEKIDPELFHFEIIAKESDGETSKLKIKFRDVIFDQVCEWRHESDAYTPMMNYCTITSPTGEVISEKSPLSDSDLGNIIWFLHKDQVLALSDKYPGVIRASEYPGIDTGGDIDVDSLFIVEDESELKSFTSDVLEIEDYNALYEYFKASYKVGYSGSNVDDYYSGISIYFNNQPSGALPTLFEWAINNF